MCLFVWMLRLTAIESSPGLRQVKIASCFLIATGPSLNRVDVRRLANLDTISFNRSYIAWKDWGFAPTYYACFDPVVYEDNVQEIHELIKSYPDTRFFLPVSQNNFIINATPRVSFVTLLSGDFFCSEFPAVTDFGNVGATSVQILALLGYKRIVLIGVDARYSRIGKSIPDKDGFVLVDDDPNHFSPDYAKGKRLNKNPDLVRSIEMWTKVAEECKRLEIEVMNASAGSSLDCFQKTDFETAIEWANRNTCLI